MDEEAFPVALLMFALAPTVCLALMWPTGNDDMWWGAVMALPFYGLASLHHLITKPYRRQRLMALGGVVLMAVVVWSWLFAAYGDPWGWDTGMFYISLAFCHAPLLTGALVFPHFARAEEHRMAIISGVVMALPLCFFSLMPATIFL